MVVKAGLCWFLLWWASASLAIIPDSISPKQPVRTISSTDVASWGFGLIIVLCVFFLCVWGVRKLSGLNVAGGEKIRMIGGLSLGMRERVILLQVGKKQLMLGVTPGRIEKLLVLEGEDCLHKEESLSAANTTGPGFAQKLAEALKPRPEQSRKDSSDA
jgi:flagellar protein FliO/FliZ